MLRYMSWIHSATLLATLKGPEYSDQNATGFHDAGMPMRVHPSPAACVQHTAANHARARHTRPHTPCSK